jgi:hypothetical protein
MDVEMATEAPAPAPVVQVAPNGGGLRKGLGLGMGMVFGIIIAVGFVIVVVCGGLIAIVSGTGATVNKAREEANRQAAAAAKAATITPAPAPAPPSTPAAAPPVSPPAASPAKPVETPAATGITTPKAGESQEAERRNVAAAALDRAMESEAAALAALEVLQGDHKAFMDQNKKFTALADAQAEVKMYEVAANTQGGAAGLAAAKAKIEKLGPISDDEVAAYRATVKQNAEAIMASHQALNDARAATASARKELAAAEAAIVEASNKAKAAEKAARANTYAPITKRQFNEIRTGMKYDEVQEILGRHGEEMSRVDIAGAPLTVMLIWKNKFTDGAGNMNITLQDGKVVAKAQFGLK